MGRTAVVIELDDTETLELQSLAWAQETGQTMTEIGIAPLWWTVEGLV